MTLPTSDRPDTDQLISGVHEKVTKYVLDKVAILLDNLEMSDTSGKFNKNRHSLRKGYRRQDMSISQQEIYTIPVQTEHTPDQLMVNLV